MSPCMPYTVMWIKKLCCSPMFEIQHSFLYYLLCRITCRYSFWLAGIGSVVVIFFSVSEIYGKLFNYLSQYSVLISLAEACRLLDRQRIAVHIVDRGIKLLREKITFSRSGVCIEVEVSVWILFTINSVHNLTILSAFAVFCFFLHYINSLKTIRLSFLKNFF